MIAIILAYPKKQIIGIDPKYFRPTEVNTLLGDASKAKKKLGWEPRTSFSNLVEEMVVKDLKEVERKEVCLSNALK